MMRYLSLLSGICLLSISCTKTKRDIALAPEMAAKAEAFIEEMAEISESFPTEPKDPAGKLDPPPVFGVEDETNTIASSTLQLAFMDTGRGMSGDDELRFYYGSSFADRLHDRYLAEPAPEGYGEYLNAMLDRPYVLAYWVLEFDTPQLIDKETFSGGSARVRFALYDRSKKEWHSAFEVSASPPERISFKGKDFQFQQNMQFHVREPVRDSILEQASKILEESTGGRFEF